MMTSKEFRIDMDVPNNTFYYCIGTLWNIASFDEQSHLMHLFKYSVRDISSYKYWELYIKKSAMNVDEFIEDKEIPTKMKGTDYLFVFKHANCAFGIATDPWGDHMAFDHKFYDEINMKHMEFGDHVVDGNGVDWICSGSFEIGVPIGITLNITLEDSIRPWSVDALDKILGGDVRR